MEWITEQPETPGEYIVMTETTFLKKRNVMFATMTIDSKGKKSWSFNNQNFVAYLK